MPDNDIVATGYASGREMNRSDIDILLSIIKSLAAENEALKSALGKQHE